VPFAREISSLNMAMKKEKLLVEYDLHPRGMRVDDALARLERIVSSERARGGGVFALVTGYGSSGGTSLIKSAVLAALGKYARQNHIRGFLDGEYAWDMFSPQYLAFRDASKIPIFYKRFPNPGMVFVSV